jgi:hypothetical protein
MKRASTVIFGYEAGKPCRQEEVDTKHRIGSASS